MDNEIDRKIDVTAILFLLVQNREQTHDWILIGSGANGLGIYTGVTSNKTDNGDKEGWHRDEKWKYGNEKICRCRKKW